MSERPDRPTPLPSRLTPRARRVLALAEEEALGVRHPEIGTEHLLVGLLREGRGLAARALRALDVDPAELAQRVRSRLVPADILPDLPIEAGPGVRAALEMARSEAARLRHDYVGTEHLLLGLLRDGEGTAFVMLVGVGVTLDRARRQIVALINEAPPEPTRPGGLVAPRGGIGPGSPAFRRDVGRLEPGRCGRCTRARRWEWRFCAFCGEPWPRCPRCDAPLPPTPGVRFCPECGGAVGDDEPGHG
ncbi:MAG: hypothetical protein IT305_15910 [Chloroflexi bacterium]|nr:hypothetical protein [Chloroflexota bacterium]